MIKDIRSAPVFRLLLGLIGGILACEIIMPVWRLLCISTGVLFIFWMSIIKARPGRRHEWIYGLIIISMYLLIGMSVKKISSSNEPGLPAMTFYSAEVITSPVLSGEYLKAAIIILKVHDESAVIKGKTGVLMIAESSADLKVPVIGDVITFYGTPEVPVGNGNPGEFSYADYLRRNGMDYSVFLKSDEWLLTGHADDFSIKRIAVRTSDYIKNRISDVKPGNKALDVFFTLTLGTKGLIDPEIRQAYSTAGVTHILSVSGLHVALIWMVISRIFLFLKKIRYGIVLYFIIIMSFLWFYSIITGLSAPVVRSSVMLSIIITGELISRHSVVYNSVFLAAFFSLAFNPQWIEDAGFQLSFSAVLGIVFFQPKIKSLLFPVYTITKWLWDLITVSISAQLGTLPLVLYYFHSFPLYFLPANLIAVPLVTIILCLFIMQVFSMIIPFLFSIVSIIQFFLVNLMNDAVAVFEHLPSPGMDSIMITRLQMWCLIALLFILSLYIRHKSNKLFILNIAVIIVISFVSGIDELKRNTYGRIAVFNVPGNFAMGVYSEGKAVLYVKDMKSEKIKKDVEFYCEGYRIANGYRRYEIIDLDSMKSTAGFYVKRLPGKENFYIRFYSRRIVLISDPLVYNGREYHKELKTDLLIASTGVNEINPLIRLLNPEQVVLTGNKVPNDYAGSPGNNFFHCRENGAYLITENQNILNILKLNVNENDIFKWIMY